jgi:hypothetical protein
MDWEKSQIDRFNKITERDIPVLLRESSSEFNFLEVRSKAEALIQTVKLLVQNIEFWQLLPQQNRDEINTKIDQIAEIFDQMQGFDPKKDNAWGARNSLVAGFENQYREIYAYLVERLSSYLGQKAYSQELSSEFGAEAKKILSDIRRSKKVIDEVEQKVKDASSVAGDVASTATAHFFDEQSENHEKQARNWLKGVGVVGCIAVATAFFISIDILHEVQADKFVANSIASVSKLVILAFTYFGLIFTTKNYSTHKHLQTVSKQRSNVLKSMEAFRASATSDEAKDAALIAGLSAAYAQEQTGFISTKEGAGANDPTVSELLSNYLKK